MSNHVLYLAVAAETSAETSDGWQDRLAAHGYNVWRTTDPDQLLLYARSRPAIAVLLDAPAPEAPLSDLAVTVRRLREEPSLVSVPIVTMLRDHGALTRIEELAAAGATAVHLHDMPESLLLHHLAAGRSMQSLRTLEESGMTVEQLANETRQKIHDLSQPLAALQGRLQILQSKTSADDPQKQKIDLMVKLTLEVGGHLRELQELHRRFS